MLLVGSLAAGAVTKHITDPATLALVDAVQLAHQSAAASQSSRLAQTAAIGHRHCSSYLLHLELASSSSCS
jgi:hypothetical protein